MDLARLHWINIVWPLLVAAFASAQTLNDPHLRVTEVAAGLVQPTAMAFIGPSDILVLQKNDGQVRRVLDGVLLPDPVLDMPIDSDGERGLLAIALHPSFPSAPFVYLYLTHSSTEDDTSGSPLPARHPLYRFTWSGLYPHRSLPHPEFAGDARAGSRRWADDLRPRQQTLCHDR